MKIVGVVDLNTQNIHNRYIDPAPLLEEFSGEPLIVRTLRKLVELELLDEVVFLPPPHGDPEQWKELAERAGARLWDYGQTPYNLNLPLAAAAALGADHGIVVSAYALFFDTQLLASTIKQHIDKTAAVTTSPGLPVGLRHYVFSVAALREVQEQSENRNDEEWLFAGLLAEQPQKFHQAEFEMKYPARITALDLNYIHAAQKTAFNAALNAVDNRGAAELFKYLDANYHEFVTFPRHVHIEVTSRCNHACGFCPQPKRSVQMDMDLAAFKRVVDGVSWCGSATGIDLAGYGEPLLHPQLWEMVEYAKKRAMPVFLYTNGTQWQDDTTARLLDSGLEAVIFGINANNPEVYKKVHGHDDLAQVRMHVLELLKLKKERGLRTPKVAVQIVKAQINNEEIEAFWREWSYTDRFERMSLSDYDHVAAQGELRMKSIEIERREKDQETRQAALKQLNVAHQQKYWDAFYRHAELPLEHVVIQRCNDFAGQLDDQRVVDFTPLQRFPCRQVSYGLMVLADGAVVPCQQDFNGTLALGNINETDLAQLWHDAKMINLQADQRAGSYDTNPLCAKCRDWYIPMV